VPLIVLSGCQWGDEGKGKIVDLISKEADLVARYQGGNNAGHTVVIDDTTFILHTIPTGILHPGTACLLGNGMVIDPEALSEEIRDLRQHGIAINTNLMISETAHLVMPYHKLLDQVQERKRGKGKIGTTGRGIGCSYGDKVTRQGVRVLDMRNKDRFVKKVRANLEFYEPLFEQIYSTNSFAPDDIIQRVWKHADMITSMAVDGVSVINQYIEQRKNILCEGAQGIHLDIDFGTYPYVTSSNPSPGGVCTGLGISPTKIDRIYGVVKAYTTRVGEGPFPTELTMEQGDNLRKLGSEYGATTGRPRRCGWFDAPLVRRALQISGIREVAITKLDVLDTLDTINICTGYRYKGRRIDIFPFGIESDDPYEPIYEELPGWKCSTEDVTKFDALPEKAKAYLHRIEELLSVKIVTVSVSPKRGKCITLIDRFF
jgi:adenylosuccinate synthase